MDEHGVSHLLANATPTDSTRTTAVTGSVVSFDAESTATQSRIAIRQAEEVESLADYQVNQLIGRGKYSQVYSAQRLRDGKVFAIKKVAIFDMMDTQARTDCLKEVKIQQSLEHPNIVKCHNSFIQDNELVIILDWAEAGDLAQLLKARSDSGQPLTTEDVLTLFIQVCSAMAHMHDRRMMHRDLKPSNIFVGSDGRVKLGDLGLSRYFSSRTLQALTTVGTPMYMSPEVIKGQPYDYSSDVWSLGVLLYELITLRNPFYKEGQSLYVLGKNINSCTYDPLPETVPVQLRQMVAAMLQPNPQQRPSVHQLVQACEACVAALRR